MSIILWIILVQFPLPFSFENHCFRSFSILKPLYNFRQKIVHWAKKGSLRKKEVELEKCAGIFSYNFWPKFCLTFTKRRNMITSNRKWKMMLSKPNKLTKAFSLIWIALVILDKDNPNNEQKCIEMYHWLWSVKKKDCKKIKATQKLIIFSKYDNMKSGNKLSQSSTPGISRPQPITASNAYSPTES